MTITTTRDALPSARTRWPDEGLVSSMARVLRAVQTIGNTGLCKLALTRAGFAAADITRCVGAAQATETYRRLAMVRPVT